MNEPPCRYLHPDVWFDHTHQDLAVALCCGCALIGPCLQLALRAEGTIPPTHRYGIYGGLTPGQRHALATADNRNQVAS